MTEFSTNPTANPGGDTNLPEPVPASKGITAKTKNRKAIKPALLIAGGAVASVGAVLVYKQLNKPVPKTEQIARKVRKYVRYLEKHDFEFPELPPHLRKTVETKSHAVAKASKKISLKAVKTLKGHWENHRSALRA